jgi:hypothetical protein
MINMMKNLKKKYSVFLLVPVIFWGWSQMSFAAGSCIRVTSTSQLSTAALNAGYTAASWTGATNANAITSLGLPGIMTISSSEAFSHQEPCWPVQQLLYDVWSSGDYTANQILFRCDQTAVNAGLYEFYATNGSDDYSGKNAASEVDGVLHLCKKCCYQIDECEEWRILLTLLEIPSVCCR